MLKLKDEPVGPIIVQAAPGSGKTFLVKKGLVVDVDDLISSMGLKPSKASTDRILDDASLKEALIALIRSQRGVVVSNIDPEVLGLPVARRVGFQARDYVRHLQAVGRTDLLQNFDSKTLGAWMSKYESDPSAVLLRPGQFLDSAIQDLIGRSGSSDKS